MKTVRNSDHRAILTQGAGVFQGLPKCEGIESKEFQPSNANP